jgi:predicted alpha/beta hydrolase family esterase
MNKIILSFLMLFTLSASASTVVLIGGITASNSWLNNGVAQQLSKDNTIKIVNVPFTAPLQVQSAYLNAELNKINGDIILVGHSAGGVVARNTLVRSGNKNIKQLITIATPNFGSKMARYSTFVNDIPFSSFMTKTIAPESYYAQYPIRQLRKNSVFLNALNSTAHPNICYTSIIKTGGAINNSFADVNSQDLRFIPNIKSTTLFTNTGHSLHYTDSYGIQKSINDCA